MIQDKLGNIQLFRSILVDHAQRIRKNYNYKIREYLVKISKYYVRTLVSILTSVQSNLKAIQEVVNCYGEKYVAKYRYDSFKSKKPRPSLKKDNYLKESLG